MMTISALLIFTNAKASDTLTVRQVFNFNIGDEFTYRRSGNALYLTLDYQDYTITNKIISPSNDTIWYARSSYGSPIDTLIITNLDSPLIYFTDSPYTFYQCNKIIIQDSACNTVRNTIKAECGLAANSLAYIEGLGLADNLVGYDDNTHDEISLVYYSKNGVGYSTPYSSLGINGPKSRPIISLGPNPAVNELHLTISDLDASNKNLFISDVLGQEMYSVKIYQSESIYDISKISPGIYIWYIMNDNIIIQSGKLIKQ